MNNGQLLLSRNCTNPLQWSLRLQLQSLITLIQLEFRCHR